MMYEYKRVLTVKVSEKLYRQIKDYIEKHGITVSEFLRWAIVEFLEKEERRHGDYIHMAK